MLEGDLRRQAGILRRRSGGLQKMVSAFDHENAELLARGLQQLPGLEPKPVPVHQYGFCQCGKAGFPARQLAWPQR